MVKRARAGFLLALAVLTLVVLAPILSSGRADVVIFMSLTLLLLLAIFITMWGVARDGEPGGRAAAIVALYAATGMVVTYVLIVLTPSDDGANIGAGILGVFSLVTLVISSLLAWLLSMGHNGPRERGTSEFEKGDPRRFHQDD